MQMNLKFTILNENAVYYMIPPMIAKLYRDGNRSVISIN